MTMTMSAKRGLLASSFEADMRHFVRYAPHQHRGMMNHRHTCVASDGSTFQNSGRGGKITHDVRGV